MAARPPIEKVPADHTVVLLHVPVGKSKIEVHEAATLVLRECGLAIASNSGESGGKCYLNFASARDAASARATLQGRRLWPSSAAVQASIKRPGPEKPTPQSEPARPGSKPHVSCRYGAACTNRACVYGHPSRDRPLERHPADNSSVSNVSVNASSKTHTQSAGTGSAVPRPTADNHNDAVNTNLALVDELAALALDKSNGAVRGDTSDGSSLDLLLVQAYSDSSERGSVLKSVAGKIFEARATHSASIGALQMELLDLQTISTADPDNEDASTLASVVERRLAIAQQQLQGFDMLVSPLLTDALRLTQSIATSSSAAAANAARYLLDRLQRETYLFRRGLPIFAYREHIDAAVVAATQVTIVSGPHGCGKSSMLPLMLLEDALSHGGGKVACLHSSDQQVVASAQHARLQWAGGKSSSGRAADVVGFSTLGPAGASLASERTRLLFSSTASFLAQLASSASAIAGAASLEGVSTLVIDDADCSDSLDTKVVVGLVQCGWFQAHFPTLRIVLTTRSAEAALSLTDRLAGGAQLIHIDYPSLPVEIRDPHVEDASDVTVSSAIKLALQLLASQDDADDGFGSGALLLIVPSSSAADHFLGELTKLLSRQRLTSPVLTSPVLASPVLAYSLHEKLRPEQVCAALAPPRDASARKVLLATPTSALRYSPSDVSVVIDCCKPGTPGSDCSGQWTADDLRALAGASGAGGTYYLWYHADDDDQNFSSAALQQQSTQTELETAVVTLLALHVDFDPLPFPWAGISEQWVQRASAGLTSAGAMSDSATTSNTTGGPALTELGTFMATSQLSLHEASLLYHGCVAGCGEAAAAVAGLLPFAGSVFWRGNTADAEDKQKAQEAHQRFYGTSAGADISALLQLYSEYKAAAASAVAGTGSAAAAAGSASASSKASVVMGTSHLTGGTHDRLTLSGDGSSLLFDGLENDEEKAQLLAAAAMQRHLYDEDDDEDAGGIDDDEDATNTAGDGSTVGGLDDSTSHGGSARGASNISAAHQAVEVRPLPLPAIASSDGVKAWCRQHYVNFKSMGEALANIRRLIHAAAQSGLWAASARQDGHLVAGPADSDDALLLEIVARSLLPNVAILSTSASSGIGHPFYHTFAADGATLLTAVPLPGSALALAMRNGQPLPSLVAFHSLAASPRPYLSGCIPITADWLQLHAPSLAANLATAAAAVSRGVSLPVSARVLQAAVKLGFVAELSRKLSDGVKLAVDVDTQQLTALCPPLHHDDVIVAMQEMVTRVRSALAAEVHEEAVAKGVRAVFGSGGEVQQLLFGKAFVTISLIGLSADVTAASLRVQAEQFGDVRCIELCRPLPAAASTSNSNNSSSNGMVIASKPPSGRYGSVTFADPAAAARALAGLSQLGLSASPGGLRPSASSSAAMSASHSARLIMSWAMAPSNGSAQLSFVRPQDANAVLALLRRNPPSASATVMTLGCPHGKKPRPGQMMLQLDGSFPTAPATAAVGGGSKKPKRGKNAAAAVAAPPAAPTLYRLNLAGLPTTVDEQDLLEHLRKHGAPQPTFCAISRGGKAPAVAKLGKPVPQYEYVGRGRRMRRVLVAQHAPQARGGAAANAAAAQPFQQDERVLVSVAEQLRPHAPLLAATGDIATSFYDPLVHTRGGLYLYYSGGPAAAEAAMAAWTRDRQQDKARGVAGPQFNGQPIRLKAQYSSWMFLHRSVYAAVRAQIEAALREAKDKGVSSKATEVEGSHGGSGGGSSAAVKGSATGSSGGGKIKLALTSDSRKQLEAAYQSLQQVLEPAVYAPPDGRQKLLFTRLGRAAMELLSTRFGLHWDAATATVRVFGPSPSVRQQGIIELEKVVTRLAGSDKQVVLWIQPHQRRVLMARRDGFLAAHGLQQLYLVGTKLTAVGSAASLESLQRDLARAGFLAAGAPAPRGGAATAAASDVSAPATECCICYCDLEEDVYEYTACGHRVCRPCGQLMFQDADRQLEVQLPAKCPNHDQCGTVLSWADIAALTTSGGLSFLRSAALSRYLMGHAASARPCPHMGCSGILDLSSAAKAAAGDAKAEAATGGALVVRCEECDVAYCLACCRDGKAVKAHKGCSCLESQAGERRDVRDHVNAINDMLNLHCPRCKQVFVDFDGCFALTCGNGACRAGFCGWCLADCGADAHQHIYQLQCRANPKPGSPFATFAEFNRVHLAAREREVREYLTRRIADGEVRRAVLALVTPQLADVGIKIVL